MPPDGGANLAVQQYLVYGKGWQRVGTVLALIAIGSALLGFGDLIGLVPTVLGLLIGVRMWGPAPLRARSFRRQVKAGPRGGPEA